MRRTVTRAFLLVGATMINLDALVHNSNPDFPYALLIGHGLNSAGKVVGFAAGASTRGFRYDGGSAAVILDPPFNFAGCVARAINDSNIVTGQATNAGGASHLVVWDANGAPTDYGAAPNTTAAIGLAINNASVGSATRQTVSSASRPRSSPAPRSRLT